MCFVVINGGDVQNMFKMLKNRTGALNINKPVTMVVGLVIAAALLSATIGSFVINFTAFEAAGGPTWVETLWYIFIGLAVAGVGYIYAKKSGLM